MTHPTDALRLVPEPRAIADAPRDGTMLRLWVRYPEVGSWTPLADAYESWTVGFNNFDNTEEDRWQIVGWCWSHDYLLEAADDVEVLGWLPFHGEAAPASPLPEGGGWQDISTAPKDGTPILITRPTSYPAEEAYHVVRWEEVDGFWFCHDGKFDTWLRGPDPTHWMPLPAAPTGDARNGKGEG